MANCAVKLKGVKDEGEDCVKFIHASDIHLGCQQYRNQHRADDFLRAFEEILSLAMEHNVDFIILGGDVFTSLEMLPGRLLKIINMLKNFKISTHGRIPIIAIEGNHDIRKFSFGAKLPNRGQSWLKLISSMRLMVLLDADLNARSEDVFKTYNFKLNLGGKLRIKNVNIHGVRYLGQQPVEFLSKIRNSIKKEDGIFNILLHHFGIEGQMENVPGVNLKDVEILKDRVDYLALGHFHRQFLLDNWIFNPGSSEAACSMDTSLKRGILLVEINGKKNFTKNVQAIRLKNRHHQWEIIFIPHKISNEQELYNIVTEKLNLALKYIKPDLKHADISMPVLNLVLKGKKPLKTCKVNEKKLRKMIVDKFQIVDVKIYQKFFDNLTTLDKYM
ncbi:MAG: metallophosphoesterase family protein [Promethearchaeota archaeon]|jgi:DNA repair exonuclease SbcCD nuclease subunit